MKLGVSVGEIMTRNFISVTPETSILECAKILMKKRVGSLILKEKDQLKGIVTERDIIWAITKKSKKELKDILAKDIAPRKLVTIKPSADLYDALLKMKRSKYKWLPVTVKGQVIGFLTLNDILRIEPGLFETASEIFYIREESAKLKRRRNGWKLKEGICEECGNFDILNRVDNRIICPSCRDAM